jgi:hypothetical protein
MLGEYREMGAFHGGRITDGRWLKNFNKYMENYACQAYQHSKEEYRTENVKWERKWMSNTYAALFVYSTVIAGWAYLATYGSLQFFSSNVVMTIFCRYQISPLFLCFSFSALSFGAAWLFGSKMRNKYSAPLDFREKILRQVLEL